MAAYDNSVIHFTGYFLPPISGAYVFNVDSDDGFQLEINGTRVLDSRVISGTNMRINGLSGAESDPITLTGGV